MKSFITRLLSGIVLVAVIVLTCWRGGDVLWALVLAISMIGLREFYKVFGLKDPDDILAAAGYLGAAAWMILCRACSGSGQTLQMEKMWLVLPALFILILAVYVFTFPRYETQQVMAVFFGVVYIPVMLSFIYQTRMGDDGFYLVWLIFLCSWGCDTFAYCTGMLIGKHRLAPVLSPKKSIEGAVGGSAWSGGAGGCLCGFHRGTSRSVRGDLRGGRSGVADRRSGSFRSEAAAWNQRLRETDTWAWRNSGPFRQCDRDGAHDLYPGGSVCIIGTFRRVYAGRKRRK